MEIKYQHLQGLVSVLERIKKECRLPVVKALHLKRVIRDVAEETKLYNESYFEIIDKYAQKDDKGERIVNRSEGNESVTLTDPQAFSKDMQELREQTFEVDERYVDLTIDDLGTIQMTVEEVEFLECILPVEEELVTDVPPKTEPELIEEQHKKIRAFPKQKRVIKPEGE